MSGSPPRVRSRRTPHNLQRTARGITSACAEQTSIVRCVKSSRTDHLRVCGADKMKNDDDRTNWGSPPRVRSRPLVGDDAGGLLGITSACAEQTGSRYRPPDNSRDHLRVCGADLMVFIRLCAVAGSPPRVRSRRRAGAACSRAVGDHLRVCGADATEACGEDHGQGSPPRVRSRPSTPSRADGKHGITSACAEQTCAWSSCRDPRRDHLRVCGADEGKPIVFLSG